MTVLEIIAALGAGATALAGIATAWARSRATVRLERRDVMKTLQEVADRQAALASKSDEQHRECRREVDGLRGRLQDQSIKITTVEGHYAALRLEHAQCPERIAKLEAQLRRTSADVALIKRTTPAAGIPSSISHPPEED